MRTVSFHIAAIAENDGYFLSDSPFTIIGTVDDGIARLLVPGGNPLYNEIYVKVADGADIEQVKKILPQSTTTKTSKSITAPIRDTFRRKPTALPHR